jgi:hypothetical protein
MPGMIRTNFNFVNKALQGGSALILTVVLTSMLAIVGILFVMMARVDKVATSAISENRELDLAVGTVIARISQELVSDIPGVAVQEYYDYPDPCNAWLASLEPEFITDNGTPADANDDIYKWPQISDVTGFLRNRPFPFATQYVNVDPVPGWGPFNQDFILDYPPIRIDANNGQLETGPQDDGRFDNEWRGQLADADGDGIADSKWIELYDVTSSTGKRIYAAVRVVDPGATLNVNTAFRFDATDPCASHIDGSSQMQINLAALARPLDDVNEIDIARCGTVAPVSTSLDWRAYQQNVIWRMENPTFGYWPFDISDELELRYRYCITSQALTRLENVWNWTVGNQSLGFKDEPYSGGSYGKRYEWQWAVTDPNVYNSSRRHLLTTYNMDRIIDPNGDEMINVNKETSPFRIYNRLWRSMYPVVPDPNTDARFAQLAVNMVDFADDDDKDLNGILDVNDGNCVSTLVDGSGVIHYGFEAQPFINEIAWQIGPTPAVTANFFALELCNPFGKDIDLGNFVLEFVSRDGTKQYSITFPIGLVIEANGYFVIVNQAGVFPIYTDPNTPTTVWPDPALRFFEDWMTFDKSKPPIDNRPDPRKDLPPIPEGWGTIYDVSLKRDVFVPAPGTMLYVDNQIIDANGADPGTALAFGRDDRDWRVIYQTLSQDSAYGGSLGIANYRHIPFDLPAYPKHLYSFFLPNPRDPRARLITVGDITRILTLGHGTTPDSTIGRQLMAYELLEVSTAIDQEHNVRLDLQNPLYRNIFQYFTVFDPNSDNIDNDADGLTDEGDGSEWKVPGRININTAPWYVLAQLPWVSSHTPSYELARAIIAYRDRVPLLDGAGNLVADYGNRTAATGSPIPLREELGFSSIGELATVVNTFDAPASVPNYRSFSMRYYIDDFDLPGFPDLTTAIPGAGDEVVDDFEERDVIFSRISNLVTVRSDVFTAYILVRIGADGPQKRAVAILDRSGVNKMNAGLPAGKVRIVSLHDVPDPR